jgi:hypothetical protein
MLCRPVRCVRPMFEQRILPITEDIMLKRRLLVEQGRKAGIRSRSATWSSPQPLSTTA